MLNIDKIIQTKLNQNYTRFLHRFFYPTFFEICSNPDYYEKLYNYGLVSFETKEKAYQVTKNMSSYSDKDKKHFIFKVPYEVGGSLLNKMWIPNEFMMDKINYYLNNVFKDNFVIGIQIRYEFIDQRRRNDLDLFIKCAQDIEANTISFNYKSIKWFVSTDTPLVLDRLIQEFPNKIITSDGKIGHAGLVQDAYPR